MPRSEHDRFIDHLTALLHELGVDFENVDGRQRERLLKELRPLPHNEHEAALVFAYGLLPGLLEDDLEQARVLLDRIAVIAEAWDHQDLIDRRRLSALERDARAALHRARD